VSTVLGITPQHYSVRNVPSARHEGDGVCRNLGTSEKSYYHGGGWLPGDLSSHQTRVLTLGIFAPKGTWALCPLTFSEFLVCTDVPDTLVQRLESPSTIYYRMPDIASLVPGKSLVAGFNLFNGGGGGGVGGGVSFAHGNKHLGDSSDSKVLVSPRKKKLKEGWGEDSEVSPRKKKARVPHLPKGTPEPRHGIEGGSGEGPPSGNDNEWGPAEGPEDGSFVTTGEGEGEGPTVSQSGEGEGPTVCPTTGNVKGPTGFVTTTGECEGVGPTVSQSGEGVGPTVSQSGEGEGLTVSQFGEGEGPTVS
jgi:hypothetical protein